MTPQFKIRASVIFWSAVIAVPVVVLSLGIIALWVVSSVAPGRVIEVVAERMIISVDALFKLREYQIRQAGYKFHTRKKYK